ncbi:ImmA/IrrE family metallo-endopeptidase [Hamadaea tsunoensis]|uniref:ImmA/IrrE family metallo-endopeptidase n=1 Tax=Hamadaea tsunoensis TaxID=53368 RepID=UPI000686A559|nr:ImmA/IrrE family metallo-endopeptidase [Hamadaea tsunoensis]
MAERTVLQRRCDSLAASLCPPVPWSLDGFVNHVRDLRDRRILLYAQPLPAGVSSFWFRAGPADHIVYARDAQSPHHRDHLVMHEIAHMLLGHAGIPLGLLNSPEAVRSLHRGTVENEAEVLARAIAARWRPPRPQPHVDADVGRVMRTYDYSWEVPPYAWRGQTICQR